MSVRDVKLVVSKRRSGEPGEESVAPVVVSVMRWADASNNLFEGGASDTPVYQFQVLHDGRPSIGYGFLSAFKAFLPTWDETVQSYEDLERRHGMRVAVAPGGEGRDPDELGVKAWRVAVYASTKEPVEVLNILGDFIKQKARGPEYAACGAPGMWVTKNSAPNLPEQLPEPWVREPAGAANPHPFDASPLRGRRHLMLQVEQRDDGDYDLMFLGNTYPFRERFDACSVEGGYVGEGDKKEYVRCLQAISLNEDGKQRMAKVLGPDGLQHHALLLLNETGSADDEMVRWLLTTHNAHRR